MPEATLVPDSDVVTQWLAAPIGSTHWSRINETVDGVTDPTTATNINTAVDAKKDRHGYTDSPADAGTISEIKTRFYWKGDGDIRLVISLHVDRGAGVVLFTAVTLDGDTNSVWTIGNYAFNETTAPTPPGGIWPLTKAEIDTLEVQVRYNASGGSGYSRPNVEFEFPE